MNTILSQPVSKSFPPLSSIHSNIEPVDRYQTAELVDLINSFVELSEDWIGPGSVPPSKLTIENANRLLEFLPDYVIDFIHADDITATPYGTIVIDIERRENLLSFEVGDKGMGYFLEINGDIKKIKDIDGFNFRFETDVEWIEIFSKLMR